MGQYTVDLPFVGPVDIKTDGTPSAGAPSGTGALVGAGVGSIVPGVGTALGATIGGLIEGAGSLFKGKTKKVPYTEADAQALKISHALAKGIQDAFIPPNFDRRAPAYIPFVENYLRTVGSGWWGGGEAKRIADELKDDVHKLYSKSSYDKVQGCMWLLVMWILTNSPADRQDWIGGYLKTHLEGAYVAYWFGTTEAPTVSTPGAIPAITTPPAIVSPRAATTDQVQKDITTYALIGGAVILIIMTGVVLLRK